MKVLPVLLVLWAMQGMTLQAASQVDFHVHPDGNDHGSGKNARVSGDDCPFATLARARDAVRDLKRQEGIARPIIVEIGAGRYELPETWLFTPEDSGKSAQILIAEAGASERFVPTTAGGEVYGNVAEVTSPDQSGLAFRVMTKAQRGNGPGGEYFVRNFTFHHNQVIHRIPGGKSGGKGPKTFQDQQLPYGNNHFDANIYHVPASTGATGKYWLWGAEMTFSQFKAVGHEAHGAVIEDGLTRDDTTPPPVPPAPAVSGTAAEPVLSGTTEPAAMILVYEDTKLLATACADDSGKWSAELTGLSAGSHTFQVAAADPVKNVSGYSTVTARIDKSKLGSQPLKESP
jgi:hypothetical protein